MRMSGWYSSIPTYQDRLDEVLVFSAVADVWARIEEERAELERKRRLEDGRRAARLLARFKRDFGDSIPITRRGRFRVYFDYRGQELWAEWAWFAGLESPGWEIGIDSLAETVRILDPGDDSHRRHLRVMLLEACETLCEYMQRREGRRLRNRTAELLKRLWGRG